MLLLPAVFPLSSSVRLALGTKTKSSMAEPTCNLHSYSIGFFSDFLHALCVVFVSHVSN